MKRTFYINFIAGALFLIANYFAIDFGNQVIGVPLIFLVGWNIFSFIELLSEQKRDNGLKILSLIPISFISLGTVSYISILMNGNYHTKIAWFFYIFWMFTFLLIIISQCLIKHFREEKYILQPLVWREPWVIITLIYILIILINAIIYPYLPGFDPYKYLVEVRKLNELNNLLPFSTEIGTRPIWYSLLIGFESVTKIDAYWFLKILLPLCLGTILIPFYLLTKNYKLSPFWQTIITLTPLCFPVMIQEFFTGRPQNIFILVLPMVIFWIITLLTENYEPKSQIWWWILLLFFSALGLKIHPFFVLALLTISCGMIIKFWPYIKKFPLQSLIYITLLGILLYPWVGKLTSGTNIEVILKPIIKSFESIQFRGWFLNGYDDIYGNHQSWPSPILYYGYYLGILFPIVLFISLKSKKLEWFNNKINFIIILTAFIPLLIAEILPRIGLFYFPDRAWIWFDLSVSFYLVIWIAQLINSSKTNKLISATLVSIISFSLFVTGYLSYSKRGYIEASDIRAGQTIQEKTGKEALFISQSNHYVLVEYYGKRNFLSLENLNRLTDKDHLENFISMNTFKSKTEFNDFLLAQSINSLEAVKKRTDNYLSSVSIDDIEKTKNSYIAGLEKDLLGLKKANKSSLITGKPIADYNEMFIIIKKDLSDMFGKGTWWRNKDNTSFSAFDEHPETFKTFYEDENIKIWKINL